MLAFASDSLRFASSLLSAVWNSTRIFCGGDSAMDRARNVTYIRLLYALVDSVPPCPGMYAVSLTNIRKYSSFSDIPKGLGGFQILESKFQYFIQTAVRDPALRHCICRLCRNSALHLASTVIKPQSPSVFSRCSVERGTLNISPFHMYHAITEFICRTWLGVGGKIWVTYHIFARRYSCVNRILLSKLKYLLYMACAVARIRSRTFQPVVSRYTNWATRPTNMF